MARKDGNTSSGKKRGRPRGKPLSPRERAQRQAAAVKTGEHSKRLLGQALPPCKVTSCPDQFPCEIKAKVESRGNGLAVCLQALGESASIDAFREAMTKGDLRGLQELNALTLAGYSTLEQRELQNVLDKGLTILKPVFGVGPDGLEQVGEVPVENPAVQNLVRISRDILGRTADAQVITPKARGEKAANEGLGRLGQAAWIHKVRKGLGGGAEGEP